MKFAHYFSGKLIDSLDKQLTDKGAEINGYMEKHNIQLKDQQVRPLTFIKVSVNDKNVFFQGGVQEDKSGGKDVSQM